MDASSHLIFWVPDWLRTEFPLPLWNCWLIGPHGVSTLHLGYFVHGEHWVKCYTEV
jgi:hypothetical protein